MLVSSYRNGFTMGTVPRVKNHTPPLRGVVNGWSPGAVRRHTKWLYSVDSAELDGAGWSFTLTLRDCPPTSEQWGRLVAAYRKRLMRAGAVRYHWVVEWQRRKVPHLHGIVYGDFGEKFGSQLVAWWLQVAAEFRPAVQSQHVALVSGPVGWLKYLSKHAARGVRHYQRHGKPEGWDKTGRLWGYGGAWPTDEPARYDLDPQASYRLRRLVRSWRVSQARASLLSAGGSVDRHRAACRRLSAARRMLKCGDENLSRVRGVSEWADEAVVAQLLLLLAGDGSAVLRRAMEPVKPSSAGAGPLGPPQGVSGPAVARSVMLSAGSV